MWGFNGVTKKLKRKEGIDEVWQIVKVFYKLFRVFVFIYLFHNLISGP